MKRGEGVLEVVVGVASIVVADGADEARHQRGVDRERLEHVRRPEEMHGELNERVVIILPHVEVVRVQRLHLRCDAV